MNMYFKMLLVPAVLIGGACSGASDSSHKVEASDTTEFISGVFYDDDGENCVVFISDEKAAAADEISAKTIILSRLQEDEFEVCDSSLPRSVGLYTIIGLDEYDQPDWSSSTEHYFFKIRGWDVLKKLCPEKDITEACSTTLDTILIKSK